MTAQVICKLTTAEESASCRCLASSYIVPTAPVTNTVFEKTSPALETFRYSLTWQIVEDEDSVLGKSNLFGSHQNILQQLRLYNEEADACCFGGMNELIRLVTRVCAAEGETTCHDTVD